MVKRLLFALTLCGCISGLASAGPNAGGTLILALAEGVVYTGDNTGYCNTAVTTCSEAVVDNAPDGAIVLQTLAAFPTGSAPRLQGITFGLRHENTGFSLSEWGHCGDFELSDTTWPDNFGGTAVTWGSAQTSQIVEVYWFGLYTYATYDPGTLRLDTNPVQGGNFADDSTPAVVDPIADFGSFGFAGAAGELTCPATTGPVGACCTPLNESCVIRSAAACAAESGVYQGDGTTCTPNPCTGQFSGACCLEDDSCTVGSEIACLNVLGDFQGVGTTCSPNPCVPPTGACCFGDGSCTVVTAGDCASGGGSYQGDGTGCSPNPCPQPQGACCFEDGSCQVLTAGACDAAGGTYQGNNSPCSPNPCPQPEPMGACCFANGDCTVLTQAECEPTPTRPEQTPPRSTTRKRGGGVYQGDGTDCDPNPCPQPGACCVPGVSCQVVPESVCDSNGGEFQGSGSDCDPDPCVEPVGACCYEDGSCSMLSEADCVASGGAYEGDGVACNPNPCPQPGEGACCFSDGSCTIATADFCAGELNGSYQGDGTDCDPNPCPQPEGACCFDDGSCQILTGSACNEAGGDYQGNDSQCDPNPCPAPSGACCFDDGACEVTDPDTCASDFGVYQGNGTSCDPNPCPQPGEGACCFDDGSCAVTDADTCASDFGVYQGDGTSCAPNPCPQPSYLMVTSEPSGASILIDGVDTGEVTPALLAVEPGEYCVGMLLPYYGGCYSSADVCPDRFSYEVGEGETVDAHCLFPHASFPVPLGAYATPNRVDATAGAPVQPVTFVVTDLGGLDVRDLDTEWVFLNNTRVRNPGITVPTPWDLSTDGKLRVTVPSDLVLESLGSIDLAQSAYSTDLDLVILTSSGDWAVGTVRIDVVTSNASASIPTLEGGFASQARPNPFAPAVWIEWNNPVTAKTDLVIYDASGRVLRRLVSEEMGAGFHQAQWDGRDSDGTEVPSGVYYYRLSVGADVLTNKLFKVR